HSSVAGMVEMATIRNRGEYQWEAQIRRKGYPAQRKTFETKSDAQAWARMIESEIDRGIFVSRVEAERTAFHQLIDRYISEIAPKHKGAYSEIKRLEALKRHPLATRIVATLTSSDFARYRDERLKIRKGNTVKRELALFQCVIEAARREWGIHLAENPVRMVNTRLMTGCFRPKAVAQQLFLIDRFSLREKVVQHHCCCDWLYSSVPTARASLQSLSRSTSSLAGCLPSSSLSTWITIGSSKAVPVITQHPCESPGMRLRDKESSVEIVLSIK
ncbi:Shufflon-specific recombinase, partial [Pseudomonas amygdali pv. mori]